MAANQDSGWAWLVLVAVFFVNLLNIGFLYGSVGVLTSEYRHEFNVSTSDSSWIGSVLIGIVLCAGPFAAYLIGRLGCRKVGVASTLLNIVGLAFSAFATQPWHVILAFSILSGLSCSCSHVATMKILTVHFDKYRHMSYAIAALGCDVAAVCFPVITRALLDSLSYKYSILSLCIVLLPSIPCAFLFRGEQHLKNIKADLGGHGVEISGDGEKTITDKSSVKLASSDDVLCTPDVQLTTPGEDKLLSNDEGEENSQPAMQEYNTLASHLKVLRKPVIIVFLINCLTWNIGITVIMVLSYTYYIDRGYTDTSASIAMTLLGVGGLVGSLSLTLISSRCRFNRLFLHLACILLLAVCLAVFPSLPSDIYLTVDLALAGYTIGTICANLGSVIEHLNGTDLFYLVYGYEMAAGGLGSFIGPVSGAALYATISPSAGFYFGAGCTFFSFLILIIYSALNKSLLTGKKQSLPPNHDSPQIIGSQISLAVRL